MSTSATWQEVETRLRPFVARRVSPSDVDDVMLPSPYPEGVTLVELEGLTASPAVPDVQLGCRRWTSRACP